MKTITLKEAYKKATPAPLLNNDKHRIQPNLSLLIQSITEDDDDTCALLAHAYNVLPEVVEALEPFLAGTAWLKPEHFENARKAIAKANKVQLP